jgi:hypothetical protein
MNIDLRKSGCFERWRHRTCLRGCVVMMRTTTPFLRHCRVSLLRLTAIYPSSLACLLACHPPLFASNHSLWLWHITNGNQCAYQLTLVLHSLTHHPLPSPWLPCLLAHTSQPCFTWYSYQIPCVPHATPLCICPSTVPRSQSHTHITTTTNTPLTCLWECHNPHSLAPCTANVLGSDWSVMPEPGSCQTFEVPAVDDVSHRRCTATHTHASACQFIPFNTLRCLGQCPPSPHPLAPTPLPFTSDPLTHHSLLSRPVAHVCSRSSSSSRTRTRAATET